jgi:competence protein ComEA
MKIGWEKIVAQLIVALLIFAAGFGAATLRYQSRPVPIEIIPPAPTATPLPAPTVAPIRVHMSGQVAQPGVYTLPPDSIVEQGVQAAGGFTDLADTPAINLAQPLQDGMQVYVPGFGENLVGENLVGQASGVPVRSGGTIGIGGVSNDQSVAQELVNINAASVAELETLPGIGPVTAQDIVDYRAANGLFASIEAIMDVPGIGEGKFAQIQELITVGP